MHECVDIIRQQLLKQLASPRVVSFPDPPQKRKGESGNETSPRGDNDDALPVQAILVLYFKSKVNVRVAVTEPRNILRAEKRVGSA